MYTQSQAAFEAV